MKPEYTYVPNSLEKNREAYFELAKKVFNLDFYSWYQYGFCKNGFIPHTLFDGEIAVSSVGVVISSFIFRGIPKKYIQISTVATHPDYRNQGLSKWLMEKVLSEWKEKCDCLYLYANDSVIDFYPKFGFVPAYEHRYSMPVEKAQGNFIKLDLSARDDINLLIEKHKQSNPFSQLTMDENIEMMLFHCLMFLRNNVYYIEEFDAIVIAEHEEDSMFCYDIYSNKDSDINRLIGIIALDNTKIVTFGFTPKMDCVVEKVNDKDSTFFILNGKENILLNNKITFPFLSRA